MKRHELKTDPAVFAAVLANLKTHEIRLNDRDFAVGDFLLLRETQHSGAEMREGAPLVYTGREIERTVSHIQTGYGLAPGWCILSFVLPRPRAALDPALKAALDEAAKTRSTVATLPGGEVAFINYGDRPEDREHLYCTACGGSGHIDDQRANVQGEGDEPIYGPREEAAGEAVKKAGLSDEVSTLCEAARRAEARCCTSMLLTISKAWERDAGLYRKLRAMHWNDKRLTVVYASDIKLGVQTYSGDLLDAEIERASRK